MKRYNILIVLAIVATLVGCNKDINTTTEEWGDVNIPLDPSKHYIHFDTEINTRGALITGNYLEDNFAVVGYQYPGLWEAEKVFATPNVFYTDKDKTEVAKPQIVEYDTVNGVFNYSPLQVWSGNHYSFFAYYPTDKDNVTLVADQGDPYIIYEPELGSDPTTLFDLMTASYIDTGVASSSSVGLEFKHRLSAIDIGARNYYEYDHDHDGGSENATPAKQVTIEITSLEVSLSNITSTSAKIYLDPTIPTELNPTTAKKAIEIVMVGSNDWAPNTFPVIPNTASDRAIRIIKKPDGEVMSTLLLLPQEQALTGNITLKYRKKYTDNGKDLYQRWEIMKNENGEYVYDEDGEPVLTYSWTELPTNETLLQAYLFDAPRELKFDRPLLEGRRYFIELTFTSDAVSVNIIAADEWDDKDDIRYEFE